MLMVIIYWLKLKEHKYDPNCIFCINNIFVKDAIATKEKYNTLLTEIRVVENELQKIHLELSNLEETQLKFKERLLLVTKYESLLLKKNVLKNNLEGLESNVIQIEMKE